MSIFKMCHNCILFTHSPRLINTLTSFFQCKTLKIENKSQFLCRKKGVSFFLATDNYKGNEKNKISQNIIIGSEYAEYGAVSRLCFFFLLFSYIYICFFNVQSVWGLDHCVAFSTWFINDGVIKLYFVVFFFVASLVFCFCTFSYRKCESVSGGGERND